MNCLFVTVIWTLYLGVCQAMPSMTSLKMPVTCNDEDFCQQKHPDYPEEVIQKLLKNQTADITQNGGTIQVGDRDGDDGESEINENVCDRMRSFDKIYEVIDDSGRLRFVVQSDDIFTQTVRIEKCKNPGRVSSSSFFSDNDLNEYQVMCETKRIDYKFLALRLDYEGFEMVQVKTGLPVCCSCRIYSPNDK